MATTLRAGVWDARHSRRFPPLNTNHCPMSTPTPLPTFRVLASDNIVNAEEASSAILRGTAEANANFYLMIGGRMRTGVVDAQGNWSYAITADDIAASGQGSEYLLFYTTHPVTGQTSSVVGRTINFDTVLPTLSVDAVAGDNAIAAHEIGAVITGMAEAGSTLTLAFGGRTVTQKVGANGQWTHAISAADIDALGQGQRSIVITAKDAAGNQTEVVRAVAVDTVAPALAFGVIAGDDVINAAEQATTISGTSEAGAQIALSLGTATVALVANASGGWSHALSASDLNSLGQGVKQIVVTATDAAGNATTQSRTVTVDTVAPNAAGAVTADFAAVSQGGHLLARSSALQFKGTVGALAAGEEVRLFDDANGDGQLSAGEQFVKATVTGGNYQGVLTLGDGAHRVGAVVVDAAGNVSAPATALDVTVDTVTQAPTVNPIAPLQSSPVVTGMAEAGAAVTLSLGASVTHTVTADAQGGFSYTVTAADLQQLGTGTVNASAQATDVAGNVSALTAFSIVLTSNDPTPTLLASALDGVTNLDPTSNLVLNYSGDVVAKAGKYIRIVDDSPQGFHGETHKNDLLIEATSAQVHVQGGRVTINPSVDLDLGSNYHIEVDAGAFIGTNGQDVAGVADATTINFSTVLPNATGSASVTSAANGAMLAGKTWHNVEGMGNAELGTMAELDAAGGAHAYVFADYSAEAARPVDRFDGVMTGDFAVALKNFGADDLIYIDNLGRNQDVNSAEAAQILMGYASHPLFMYAAAPANMYGGTLMVQLETNAAQQQFQTLDEMRTALGLASSNYTIA